MRVNIARVPVVIEIGFDGVFESSVPVVAHELLFVVRGGQEVRVSLSREWAWCC